ncbi:MAG: hypothetical protein WAM13_12100 [Candidatus Sulfotelmatobacter sp.]
MTAHSESLEERLRFVKHNGHAIYSIDLTHCTAKELLVLLDLIRADIARHAPGSVLTFWTSPARRSTSRSPRGSKKFWCSIVHM